MSEFLLGLAAALGAVLAWFVRGVFAERARSERDAARAEAEMARRKAAAGENEAAKLNSLREKEDGIRASDASEIAAGLDAVFKPGRVR
ncbi:MAG: hypothetical protein LBB52_04005 [Desulfovibrio sp.]|jgi:hypothetical protein|nr:hypothetical protein [Desulfovibrio sp.]